MMRPMIYSDNFVGNVFDDFFSHPFFRAESAGSAKNVSQMRTDIRESEDSYQIDMDLPGFSKEDVRAELKDGYLTVQANRSEESEKKDEEERYIRRERYSGHYQRSFYVGDALTQEDISAKFTDGVLQIEVPKAEKKPESDESKYITIQD